MRLRRRFSRWLLVMALTLAVGGVTTPAMAASPRVHVAVTPSTAHVGSLVVISGVVSPHKARPLTVERLVGKDWKPLVRGKSAKTGAFSLKLRAPAKAVNWALRVVAGATSSTLHVHVVKPVFVVHVAAASPLIAGSPIQVTGSVTPKAGGTVWLQLLQGKVWHNLSSAKLSKSATFVLRHTEPVGSYRLRVVKAFSATVAAGTSKAFAVVVAPLPTVVTTPGAPTITTTSLPGGTAELPYSATLAATGGVGPYTWTATGLPVGLSMSATGVLSGVPAVAGTSSVTVTVSGGGQASVVLTVAVVLSPSAGNTVWGWGDNVFGQLGDGTTSAGRYPVKAVGLTGVTQIAGGPLALRFNGTVWAWGFNDDGRLGNGTTTSSLVPLQVPGLSSVIAVAGSSDVSYALKSDGTVWAWGTGAQGQIGNGVKANSLVPAQVTGITTATAIAAFKDTGYALLADGTVRAWGQGTHDELGNGHALNSATPVVVTGLTGVKAIAAGGTAGYALLADGTVRAWGNNDSGQLGNGTFTKSAVPVTVTGLTSVQAIAAGGYAAYALRTNGHLRAWGEDEDQELGDGGSTKSNTTVAVLGQTSVTAVAGGAANGYSVHTDGRVESWGSGEGGALGNGSDFEGSESPGYASGLTHALAVAGNFGSGYALIGSP